MKKPQILVVGSMNMDLLMYGMETLPQWGTSTFGTGHQYAAGGKGFNQAYATAVQGADTYLVGRIGDDDNGQTLLRHLKDCGVHTEYVVSDARYSTGLSTMNMGPEGKYFSIYSPGANNHIEIQDVERALAGHDFDLIAIQLEMPLEVVYKICRLSTERHIPLFLDAGPAMRIPMEHLQGAFIISPNEAETKALTGITADTWEQVETAAKIIYEAAKPQYVLLKLGRRGAYLYSGTIKKVIPGFVVQAIDTTAAGDTFGAAFCVQYCSSGNLEQSIRFAHAAAAICVTRKGGQPSIPTRAEAEAFFEARNTQ